MKSTKAYIEFNIDQAILNGLTRDEAKALPILTEAAKLLSNIYLLQEQGSKKYLGANFYPVDISDDEIQKIALKNPDILSPYTVVEKNKKGYLEAVHYHIKYRTQLKKISEVLHLAGSIIEDEAFSNYLHVAADTLLSGDYKKMDVAWLATGQSTLQFLIGPYERYLDKRFFKKMTYLAWLGIQDNYYTKKAEEIRNTLFTTISDRPHRYTVPAKVKMSVVRNILFSGFIARALTSTEHIPSDDQTIRESGSRLIGYLSTMDYKFDRLLYPIFNLIFEKRFRESYPEDLLRRANYYLMLVYGLARQLHRYESSRERLKELFPVIDEVNSMVSGIQHSKHLVLKGVIDQKDLEAMIIVHICWCFSEWIFAKTSQIRSDYLRGDSLALNFYFQNQALRESEGISWPNFSKVFFVIEHLSTIFVDFLADGTYKDAQNFIKLNLSFEIFKAFDSKLSRISFKN